MGVVKADGYGHGDVYIARELAACGVDFFAVSNLEEALSLRRGGISGGVLILGYTPETEASVLAGEGISQAVFSTAYANALSGECVRQGVEVRVHVKIDTGMSRIGIPENDAASSAGEAAAICRLPGLRPEGIFSHFSSADSLDGESLAYTRAQSERFARAVGALSAMGISFPMRHLQNSAGIGFLPQLRWDYARAGIILYGIAPSSESFPFPLAPVMELKTVVAMVKEIPAGTAVSYGRRFVSSSPMRVATVPVGYGDGYPRLLSGRSHMLLHGRRAPVIGNICMDQLMLDVTEIPGVQMGDEVTVAGRDGDEEVTFAQLAELIGTIPYELVCQVSRRVPRVYLGGKEAAKSAASLS